MVEEKTLVIVGNGMATGRLLDDLEKLDHKGLRICVIGDEPVGGYNRIMLSPVLAGEIDAHSIVSKPADWFAQRGIQFHCGVRVEFIDRQKQCVVTNQGDSIHYDMLVLATGSRPAKIPAHNQHLDGVTAFRTLADVGRIQAMIGAAKAARAQARALVIGGGFLGLEAAYGIASQGLPVTLVHRSGWLLNRQMDATAAGYLQKVMETKNIQFCLSAEVETFLGDDRVQGARLKNGEVVDCDLAVIATGITPNKELGQVAGLEVNRGIVVDGYMRTSDAAIYALGECVELDGETFGLVEPIWLQSKVLAATLAEHPCEPFCNLAVATKLKVSGVQLFSAGQHLSNPDLRELIYDDPHGPVYRKLLLSEGQIVGTVLFGDTRFGQEYVDLMLGEASVSGHLESILFAPPRDDAA